MNSFWQNFNGNFDEISMNKHCSLVDKKCYAMVVRWENACHK